MGLCLGLLLLLGRAREKSVMGKDRVIGQPVKKDQGEVTGEDLKNAVCLGFILALFIIGLVH